tara:strand:+ start:1043 stop:1339 length:297 start_codon:yes stop_codon:yes gene_type:complete
MDELVAFIKRAVKQLVVYVVIIFTTLQFARFDLAYCYPAHQPFPTEAYLWLMCLGASILIAGKLAWDQIKPNNLLVGGKLASITTSTRSVRRRKGEQL